MPMNNKNNYGPQNKAKGVYKKPGTVKTPVMKGDKYAK
jgi:hypothetical protein